MLCTVMLVTIGMGQSYVFAQNSTATPTHDNAPITPAPQPSGDNSDDSSSDDDNDESSNSSGSDNDDDDSSGDESDSQQDTSSSEDEDETEADFDQTNPLLEQIRNRVYGTLSAAGVPVP